MARAALLAFASCLALASGARAEFLFVASYGSDAAECGASAAPCRSITKALAEAANGDTIEVGPGLYGDVDGDGTFGEAGEEPIATGMGTCDCMIRVNKRVLVRSRDGASATRIDAGGAAPRVVLMDTDGAFLGLLGQGFTIAGAATGVAIDLAIENPGASGMQLVDLEIEGATTAGITSDVRSTRIFNTRVTGASTGFLITGNSPLLVDSQALVGGVGFQLDGTTARLQRCIAAGNDVGFAFEGDPNSHDDSNVVHQLDASSAIANRQAGVITDYPMRLTRTTLQANGAVAGTNCGLVNSTTFPGPGGSTALAVTDVWWGAPTGPGPDPADAICVPSPGTAGILVRTLDAKREWKVKLPRID